MEVRGVRKSLIKQLLSDFSDKEPYFLCHHVSVTLCLISTRFPLQKNVFREVNATLNVCKTLRKPLVHYGSLQMLFSKICPKQSHYFTFNETIFYAKSVA